MKKRYKMENPEDKPEEITEEQFRELQKYYRDNHINNIIFSNIQEKFSIITPNTKEVRKWGKTQKGFLTIRQTFSSSKK